MRNAGVTPFNFAGHTATLIKNNNFKYEECSRAFFVLLLQ